MQQALARRLDVEPWVQIVASVRAKSGDAVAPESGAACVARRALSDLVQPATGEAERGEVEERDT
jgi:hypothetical protein